MLDGGAPLDVGDRLQAHEVTAVALRRVPALPRRVVASYVARRVLQAVSTIFIVATFTFFLLRLMPGNPVDAFVAQQVAQGSTYEAARAAALAQFQINTNEPLFLQYLSYLGNLLHGNLGQSLVSSGTPVSRIIIDYLPWTLVTVGISLIISFILGTAAGTFMAYRRGGWFDNTVSALASLVHSIPNYVFGVLLLLFVGAKWHLIDITSMQGTLSPGVTPSLSFQFFGNALYHASFPILVYVLTTFGGWALAMKGSTEATLREDYVTSAVGRGLRERVILVRYVARNAALPLFTQLTVSIGFTVSASVIVETLFTYNGLGSQLTTAITGRDYSVLQGIFLVITTMVVLSNLAADLLYSRLDPRVNTAARRR